MLKPGILATQSVSTMPLEWFSRDDRDGSICTGWKRLLLFGADKQMVNQQRAPQSKQHSSSSYAARTFAVLTWAWTAPLTSDGFFCWWRTHVLLVPVLFEDLDHGLTWPAATQRDRREPGHREQIHHKYTNIRAFEPVPHLNWDYVMSRSVDLLWWNWNL